MCAGVRHWECVRVCLCKRVRVLSCVASERVARARVS